jgi:hypothetical protein
MPVTVPTFADKWIRAASGATNLPYNFVACHVFTVSGFDANLVSPDGGHGPYQMTPSQFYSVWHGSPLSWGDATVAYGLLMNKLLRRFAGDVRLAVMAYSPASPVPQLAAEYADKILACAGLDNIQSRGGTDKQIAALELLDPNVQADDWSWYVGRGAEWLTELAGSANYWVPYIQRL